MIQAIFITSALTSTAPAEPGVKFALSESTRCETTKTVTQHLSSSMTEESTSFRSQWKFEATIPFSAAEWTQLGQDGTVSLRIGKRNIERKISALDGFNPKSHTFTFKLTRPLVVFSGFKFLTLPTDKPAPPAPAPGTRIVYGQGSLKFRGATLKITLSTVEKSGPSLAGESFVAVADGSFEGKLPLEVTAGAQHRDAELRITGSAKHSDIRKGDPTGSSVVGSIVELSLNGKA